MSFMTGVGARSLARSELLLKKAATSARLITERPCVQIAAGPSSIIFLRIFIGDEK